MATFDPDAVEEATLEMETQLEPNLPPPLPPRPPARPITGGSGDGADAPGERVVVLAGPFADFEGDVVDVDPARRMVRVLVNIFDRRTPVELDFSEVRTL